jgi:hypothetical protein
VPAKRSGRSRAALRNPWRHWQSILMTAGAWGRRQQLSRSGQAASALEVKLSD